MRKDGGKGYSLHMRSDEYFIVFPEGDMQEIPSPLRIGQIVDLNGTPLHPPLASAKIIAFRVSRIRRKEERSLSTVLHDLELLGVGELAAYARS